MRRVRCPAVLLCRAILVVAAAPALAQGDPGDVPQSPAAAGWLQRYPDDDLPELLFELDRPGGRLQRYAKLAAAGARAHEALIGMLRRPFAPVTPDLLDAFGAVGPDLAWAVPVLREAIADPQRQHVAAELLRRIGPRDAAAAAAPQDPDVPELLQLLRAGPPEQRWPALQAVLARHDRDAAAAALRELLLLQLRPEAAARARRLRNVLHCVWRGRVPVAPAGAATDPAALAAAVLDAALMRLPVHEAPFVGPAVGTGDESLYAAVALYVAAARPDGGRDLAWDSLRQHPGVAGAAGDLRPLLRPVVSDEERQEAIALLRRWDADPQSIAGQDHRVAVRQLDTVPPELVPILVRALDDPRLQWFARASLLADGHANVPALLAACADPATSSRRELLFLLGQLRPTPPELARRLCDLVLAPGPRDEAAHAALTQADREVVADELLRRLGEGTPTMRLLDLSRDYGGARLADARRAGMSALLAGDLRQLTDGELHRVLWDLGQQGDAGFRRMVELLEVDDRRLRTIAVRAFGNPQWNRPEQVDVLLRFFAAADAEIARLAAEGLGMVATRHDEVFAALRARWETADEAMRQSLVVAFAGLGPAAMAAMELVEPRQDAGAPPQVRLQAAWARLRMQRDHAGAATTVRALLADADPQVRCRTLQQLRMDPAIHEAFAADVLQRIDDPAPEVTLEVLRSLHRLPPGYARQVADAVRRFALSPEARLQLWATMVLREKVDASAPKK